MNNTCLHNEAKWKYKKKENGNTQVAQYSSTCSSLRSITAGVHLLWPIEELVLFYLNIFQRYRDEK